VSEPLRYARQTILPEIGPDGQARLGRATVLIVGLGGLGCPAAEYLATSGVGRLLLNDFDRVDESNLPRQILYGPEDVGELKVAASEKRLKALNPEVAIEKLPARLTDTELDEAVGRADVVLDGTDNFAARFAVNKACVDANVPLVSGAAVRLEGQLVVFPNAPGGPCYRCLYNDEDEWLGDCQGNGVLAPVPGVIGTLMAVEALKILVGETAAEHSRLWLWDAKTGNWSSVKIQPDPDCPVCGRR